MLRKTCFLILLLLVIFIPRLEANATAQVQWAELQLFLDPVYPMMVDVYTSVESEADVWVQSLTEVLGVEPTLEQDGQYIGDDGLERWYFYFTIPNQFAGQRSLEKTFSLDYAPLLKDAQTLELDEFWLYETIDQGSMAVNLKVESGGKTFSLDDSQWLDSELIGASSTKVTYTISPEGVSPWKLSLPVVLSVGWVLFLMIFARRRTNQQGRDWYLPSAIISVLVLVPILGKIMNLPEYLLGGFNFFSAAATLIVAGIIPRMIILGGFTALQWWTATTSKANLMGKLLLQWAKFVPMTLAAGIYLTVQFVSTPLALGLTVAAAAVVYLINMAIERGYGWMVSPKPVQDPITLSALDKISMRLNLSVPRLYIIDEYTGISGYKAFCQNMYTPGIYFQSEAHSALDTEETEFVLAHETAHIQLGHLSKIYANRQLSGLLFIAFSALAGILGGFWPALLGAILMLGFRVSLGRKALVREQETDALAVSLTGNPEAAIAALDKLAGEKIKNRADMVRRKQALAKISGDSSNPPAS